MLITENENPNLISVDVDLVSAPELEIDEDFGNTSTPTDTERLFNFDIDCQTLGSDDVHLQQMSSDLEIPMVLDEDTQLTCDGSGSGSDHRSLFLDSFLDPIYGMDDFIDPIRVWDNEPPQNILPNFSECIVKEEIDFSSASPQFINENSDSWPLPPSLESKYVLETPPISPPSQASSSSSSSENSPPSTPSPPLKNIISSPSTSLTFSSPPGPVMVVSQLSNLMGSNINSENNTSPIIQLASSSTQSPRKRIKIVPKPESSLLPSATLNSISKSSTQKTSNDNKSNGTKPSTRTIVLSAQDFAALTQQVKQNPIAPTIKIQTVPPKAAPSLSDSQMLDIPKLPMTVVKSEPQVTTSPKKVPLSPPQPPITLNVSGTTQGRKQELEIKAIKRQQRMIKNRESACLSRKKKKEYVTSLENQITELHRENIQIKLENIALKERLKIYEENATWKRPSLQARKATVVLVVLLVVSFNLSYSALWTSRNSLNWPEPDPSFFSKRQIVKENSPNLNSKPLSSGSSLPKARLARALLWNPQSSEEEYDSIANATRSMMCPMFINQTESLRLDSELRRWIGVENSTTKSSRQLSLPTEESKLAPSIFFPRHKKRLRTGRKKSSPAINAIELYNSRSQYTQYAAFFDAIHRRDDTFYVVSFSGDHLLLPALAHNKTLRPKMSLVFPALPINESDHITMMQIDCEVINTQLVHLKEVDVPVHLLRNRNTTTSPSPSHPRSNPPGNNAHRAAASKPSYPQRYRPYFVKDESELDQETDQVLYTEKAKKYIQKKFP